MGRHECGRNNDACACRETSGKTAETPDDHPPERPDRLKGRLTYNDTIWIRLEEPAKMFFHAESFRTDAGSRRDGRADWEGEAGWKWESGPGRGKRAAVPIRR